ncbi:DDE-type integrase/transposase/recombinase [Streptomyces virginiae]
MKKARAAQNNGSGPGAVRAADDTDDELKRLRKLTVEQATTIEVLKEATALFVKESDRRARYAGSSVGEGELHDYAALQRNEDRPQHVLRVGCRRRGPAKRGDGGTRALAHESHQGRVVNRKRVERVMWEHGIAGNSRRTGRRSLTRADTKAVLSPDLIGRGFTASRPGTKIVGDITYTPTAEGWLNLASRLDLATREVIGYSMADHHRADLFVDAFDMAAALGRLEPGCVIHSDRGSECASVNYSPEQANWGTSKVWAGPEAALTTPLRRASGPC